MTTNADPDMEPVEHAPAATEIRPYDSSGNLVAGLAQVFNTALHIGRSWGGPGPLEADCPCPKAGCGLVATDTASTDCDQHGPPPHPPRSMRSGHTADRCPGATP